jgi:hypothetical protein
MGDPLTEQSKPKRKLIESPRFVYLYLISLLLFILVSGYILIFSSSIVIEGIINGWYRNIAEPSDNFALWAAFLTAFPCLLGLVGGILTLSTIPQSYHRAKILMFVPSAVWSFQLILQNFTWGLQYWEQLLYLFPSLMLSAFILFCVAKQVRIPLLSVKPGKKNLEQAAATDVTE